MKLVNLTPHEIVVVRDDTPPVVDDIEPYVVCRIPPSGTVARLTTRRVRAGQLGDIPLVTIQYGELTPTYIPQQEGIYYIVSLVVFEAVKRDDFITPDTSPESAVRNSKGQIVGVKAFITRRGPVTITG